MAEAGPLNEACPMDCDFILNHEEFMSLFKKLNSKYDRNLKNIINNYTTKANDDSNIANPVLKQYLKHYLDKNIETYYYLNHVLTGLVSRSNYTICEILKLYQLLHYDKRVPLYLKGIDEHEQLYINSGTPSEQSKNFYNYIPFYDVSEADKPLPIDFTADTLGLTYKKFFTYDEQIEGLKKQIK